MCSKLEGSFKHICLTTGHMHIYAWSDMTFKFQKTKKISETHETLLDVMSCHQDDVVQKLACLTKVWTHAPHKPEQLARRFVVPRGTMHV